MVVYEIHSLMIMYFFTGAAAEFYGHTPETVCVGDDGSFTGDLGKLQAKRSVDPDAPPHVALANASLESKAIAAFTKRYGPITEPSVSYAAGVRELRGVGTVQEWPDAGRPYPGPQKGSDAAHLFTPPNLLSLGMDQAVRESFSFSRNYFAERQDRLRLAWRGERTAIAMLRQSISVANFQVSLYGGSAEGNKVLLRTRLLWDYVSLIFLIDHDSGRARVCANRECETPYFIQRRTDKEFCSHRCAVRMNNARRAQQEPQPKLERRKQTNVDHKRRA